MWKKRSKNFSFLLFLNKYQKILKKTCGNVDKTVDFSHFLHICVIFVKFKKSIENKIYYIYNNLCKILNFYYLKEGKGKTKMLKNKSAILLLVIAIVSLLSVSVFAEETSIKPKYDNETATITLDGDYSASGCWAAIYADNGSNLTINGNGNVHGESCDGRDGGDKCGCSTTVGAFNGSTIEINGGNYTNEEDKVSDDPTHVDLIYASTNSHIVINGGTFKNVTPKWTLNCKNNSNSSITVKGGKFFNYDPRVAPDKASEGEVIVADGYTVVGPDAEGWYEVRKEDTSKVYENETKTLNIEGLNISATGCYAAIQAKGEKTNLTINGNGNVHGLVCDGTYEGCNGCGCSTTVGAWDGATIVINGGNYTNDPDTVSEDRSHVDLIYVKNGGKIIINGGTFKCATPRWTLNSNNEKVGTIIVQGGRYYQFDPSNPNVDDNQITVSKGYTVVGPDAEGWYEVVCAHTETTKTDAKAATYTTDGNIEYYTCNNCKKLFKDEACTTETNAIEVIVPMLIQVNGGNASVGDVVVDEAIKDSGNSSVVEIPAVGNATSVTVPVASVNEVVAADKGLTVETKDTTVTLDAKAVEEVAKQAGTATNITIEVTKTEEKTLNKEQKEAIKDKEVAIVLSAKILADGNEISKFNGGKVKVEIPFTPAEGTKGSDYKVYYVADDGKVTAIPTRYVKEKLVVELEHFSEYVVVKEVATAAPAPSAPAASANPNEKDNTPKTGAVSVIGLVVAMSVIGLAVLRKRD